MNETDEIVFAALNFAPRSCAEVAEISGIPRDQTYRSLYKLMKKGLVKNLKGVSRDPDDTTQFTTPGQYVRS